MEIFEKYDYVSNLDILEISNNFNNKILKAVHIDTYHNKPYMLYSRTLENNVSVILENGRMILKRNDRHKTSVMNVVLSDIDNFMIKKCGESNRELLFNIHNVCFKILAIF